MLLIMVLETEYRREAMIYKQSKGTKGDAGEHGAGDQEMIGVLRVERECTVVDAQLTVYCT